MLYNYDFFEDALRLGNMFSGCFKTIPSAKSSEEPFINLYENGDSITVKAIVPGIHSDELNIELTGRTLNIEGERKSGYTDNPYLRKERSFGKFRKSVTLPFDVDRDKIKAALSDGIFTITFEKSEQAKSRKIEIA
jgi:HSP20 family protein